MGKRARVLVVLFTAALASGMWSAEHAVAGQEPPTIVGPATAAITRDKSATIYAATERPVRVHLIGVDATAHCRSADSPEGLCEPKDGLVEVEVTTTSTEASDGSIVLADLATGQSASASVSISTAVDPTQPTKTTIPIKGCASWYSTHWFGCPNEGATRRDVDDDLKMPEGAAVVSGTAGTGTVTVGAGGKVATIASVDGFGESTGKLGAGESVMEITVRRRAPLLFGFVVVLVGAFLAAVVGWFAQWARAKSDGDIAQTRYAELSQDAEQQRAEASAMLTEAGEAQAAGAWDLGTQPGEVTPTPLLPAEQRSPDAVAQYEKALGVQAATWRKLQSLAQTKAEVDAHGPRQRLAWWIGNIIEAGPDDASFEASYRWSQAARRYLKDPGAPRRDELLGAATTDDVIRALRGQPPGGAEAAEARRTGVREEPAMPATPTSAWSRVRAWLAKPLGPTDRLGICLAAAAVITFAVVVVPRLFSWPTLLATAIYALALVGIPLAFSRARKVKKLPVLVVAVVGTALAAAFGGADAVDASKAWGSPSDIVKTIGASFTVVGALELLRFGLPKVTAVTSK
jgi:hypothetical protein